MKKLFLILIWVILAFQVSNAQVTENEQKLQIQSADSLDGWKNGGAVFLNLSQTSLTNWATGGENSLAINGLASVFANYKRGNSVWDNSLDIGYGMLKQGNKDFIKTDDKIDFLSKYGQKAYKSWYYAAMLNFKTQMTPGYFYQTDSTKTRISDIMSPAYILAAVGLDYKPNDVISVFIAPLTGKMTIVNDQVLSDSGAFGVDRGKNFRGEFGAYIRMAFKKDLMDNVNFSTKIDLFSNYLQNPQNIDVNWETLLTLKVNSFLSASLSTLLIYDDDILIEKDSNGDGIIEANEKKPRLQFKEVLAVGVTLKF